MAIFRFRRVLTIAVILALAGCAGGNQSTLPHPVTASAPAGAAATAAPKSSVRHTKGTVGCSSPLDGDMNCQGDPGSCPATGLYQDNCNTSSDPSGPDLAYTCIVGEDGLLDDQLGRLRPTLCLNLTTGNYIPVETYPPPGP